MNLFHRWQRTWQAVGVDQPAPALFGELCDRYSEAHRVYHTLRHLEECFDHLDRCPAVPVSRGVLEVALWFHDAIYDTQRQDNEVLSADWAAESLRTAGASEDVIQNVRGYRRRSC